MSFAALASTFVLATSASASGSIEIPAGDTVTLSAAFGDPNVDPTNCPADTLAYGYQLSGSEAVQLDTGSGCEGAAGTTIGPFDAATSLKIYVTDLSCPNTYYSDGTGDGNHALVTAESASTYGVSLMDCNVGGDTFDDRVPPGDGTGNLNVTVTLTGPPPSATIDSPPDGNTYYVGEVVPTSFSCAPGANGPALSSCNDDNASSPTDTTSGGAGTLDTSAPGNYSYNVTATSMDGQQATASRSYTVAGPPTATIDSPSDGATYYLNDPAPTGFSCTDADSAPGISSCTDSNASTSPGSLDTSTPGTFAYSVTAKSSDGLTTTTTIHYTVRGPTTVTINSPSDGATYNQGAAVATSFTCSDPNEGDTITSCLDSSNKTSGSSLDTSTPGTHAYSVTATSIDGLDTTTTTTTTVHYTVAGPPVATINSPSDGATYNLNDPAPTGFTCTDGVGAPGISGCKDSNSSASPGSLDTTSPGTFAYTVTAKSIDGLSTTSTIHYTVHGPPTATINSPSDGATYNLNAPAPTAFTCTDAVGAPDITSCKDSNSSASPGALVTSSPGTFAYTVTATSGDGLSTTKTIHYTVHGPPVATISSPSDGATYNLNAPAPTAFTCTDPNGPGISSCTDSNASAGPGALNTSVAGTFAYTVTAKSSDGLTTTKTIHYTVIGPPTVTISSPSDGATYNLNAPAPTAFTCTDAAGAPGISSCKDSNASTSPGSLNTSNAGPFAYTVTATSGDGQVTTKTIHYTVVYVAPTNSAPPVVTGTDQQGATLTTTNGTWSGDPTPTYTYSWLRCAGSTCSTIAGATANAYVASAQDVGDTIEAVVTATNPGGSPSATSAPTSLILIAAPVNDVAPGISGTAQAGEILTASSGTWENSPDSYAYQWFDCDSAGLGCSLIGNADSSSYTAGITDVGSTLRVSVTASNGGGNASVMSGATVAITVGVPANSSPPAVSGTAQQGQPLVASPGGWTNSPGAFSYQWLQCDAGGASCSPISQATGSSYLPGPGDVGHTLRVTVTATNTIGHKSATSGPTAVVAMAAPVNTSPPAIFGPDVQAQVLSASNGGWDNSPTAFAYQWLQCDATGNGCSSIAGAMASSYIPTDADVGHALRVKVTATNSGDSTSVTSGPTVAIVGLTPPTTTTPPPVLDSSSDVNPVSGTILVRLPGSSTFTTLPAGASVPLGSTIDATNGSVSVTVSLPGGGTQTGVFYGGEFVLLQSPNGTTTPVLTGGSFNGCPTPTTTNGALASTASKKKKKKPKTVIRQLWGSAHGKYTTKGRYGSASVSGTIWLVQDRCDGTYIEATKDNVIVVAYANPHTRYNIQQGHHILIPPPPGG